MVFDTRFDSSFNYSILSYFIDIPLRSRMPTAQISVHNEIWCSAVMYDRLWESCLSYEVSSEQVLAYNFLIIPHVIYS